jgi:hypothetical protein
VSKQTGVKYKKSEMSARPSFGGEMEVNEGDLSEVEFVVRSFEPEPCIDGHGYDKDEFGQVRVRFLEVVDILADSYVGSGRVEKYCRCAHVSEDRKCPV